METFENHYSALLQTLEKNMHTADLPLIDKAVTYANEKLQFQKRKDGSPYIIHPLAVAAIVSEMGLDTDAILGLCFTTASRILMPAMTRSPGSLAIPLQSWWKALPS